jgi:hypothetical protein
MQLGRARFLLNDMVHSHPGRTKRCALLTSHDMLYGLYIEDKTFNAAKQIPHTQVN